MTTVFGPIYFNPKSSLYYGVSADTTIIAYRGPAAVGAGATVINDGTISGGAYAIDFAEKAGGRLVIDAASAITGAVQGGGGTLELAADGATIGNFSAAMHAQFSNFSAIQIDPGALWDFTGTFTLGAAVALLNNGKLDESATARLTIDGPLTGAGTIGVSQKPLTLNGSVAAGQHISFSGTGDTLDLGSPQTFNGQIEDFAAGDTIDLTGIKLSAVTATHFAGGVLTLMEAGGEFTFTFANPSVFGADQFALFSDAGGTGITLTATQAGLAGAYAARTLARALAGASPAASPSWPPPGPNFPAVSLTAAVTFGG